jgi:hypothetical protein
MENYSNYQKALGDFYRLAAAWNFAKITDNKEEEQKQVAPLKEKALTLRAELNKLPLDMIRPEVKNHIEKILSIES